MDKQLMEKLQESGTKILGFIEATGESTVDFAKEQVPLVVHDVLNWGMVSNGINVTVYFLLMIFMLIYFKMTASRIWMMQKKDGGNPWIMLYISYIPIIPFFCFFVCYLLDLCKIIFAPRLYLLEQLQILVKGMK